MVRRAYGIWTMDQASKHQLSFRLSIRLGVIANIFPRSYAKALELSSFERLGN